MSNYTTQVRFICESYDHRTESAGYDQINDIIHNVHNDIIGPYPIFDETYRETLNAKILKHYYTREICEETVGLWKLRLNNRMNEIMPYYNKLYLSELYKFNPLYDVDITTSKVKSGEASESLTSNAAEKKTDSKITDATRERNTENENKRTDLRTNASDSEESRSTDTSSSNENENVTNAIGSSTTQNTRTQKDKYSDTPQGGLTGIENDKYLTNARIISGTEGDESNTVQTNNSNGKTTFTEAASLSVSVNGSELESLESGESGSSKDTSSDSISETSAGDRSSTKSDNKTINNTEDYIEHVSGKRAGGSFSKMLMEYRDSLLNIDQMIINSLNDLFFGLWE